MMMLKYVLFILAAAAVIGGAIGGIHLVKVAHRNQKEMAPFQGAPTPYTANLGKTLVIYYSMTGHTQDIARRIQQRTGADVYRLETEEPLKASPAFYAKVKKQLKTGQYPRLAGPAPELDGYDVIFVGAPVWWYTAATPMLAFLQQTDFKGKKVVPFSTQGSNYGAFFEDFEKNARNARILTGTSFNNLGDEYNSAVDNKITAWLNALN